MPRHHYRHPGDAVHQRHVLRRLVRPSGRRRIVRPPDAHQHSASPLVPEVQLDLLIRPFDEERRVGVHDRPHPRQGEAAGHADHQLFPDAHVEHPVRVPGHVLGEHVGGDLRQHHRGQRILRQQRRSRLRENGTHVGHHPSSLLSTSATTSCGPPEAEPEPAPADVTRNAAASASWSRPDTRVTGQPAAAKCASIPPGPQPHDDERLSTATTVRLGSPAAPAYTIASLLLPSSSSASPTSTYTRGTLRPCASSPCATPTPRGRPCPSDPLEISTPGTSEWSGWYPSGDETEPKSGSHVSGMNSLAASTA